MTRKYSREIRPGVNVGYLDAKKRTLSLDQLAEQEEFSAETEEDLSPQEIWLNAFNYKPVFKK